MSGTFSKSARPVLPGAFFDFQSTAQSVVPPNTNGVVAVPIVHDWGPDSTPVMCTSLADFQAKFGPTQTTPGYIAVSQCFIGEGLPGRGGAGNVLVYRMVGSSGAPAVKALSNTTPATALTLTAKSKGSYGNSLSATVQVNAVDNTKNDLVLILSGVAVETYTHTPTDIAGLAATVNAQSGWVSAVSNITGVALATVTGSAFASGNDGSTLIAGDWTNMQTGIQTSRFGLFAPYDLTSGSILTSLKTWADGLNSSGRRFLTVVGGALDENVSTAISRSQSLVDPWFVNIGVGGVTDAVLGTLSTSQLAPRVAGILAQRSEEKSLTRARFNGVTARSTLAADPTGVLQAFNAGVTVLAQDSHPTAPVCIAKGVTTYTGGVAAQPYLIYRVPKFVRTMMGIENELTDWFEQNVVGLMQVNDSTRALVVGEAVRRIKSREDRGILQSGSTVTVDPNPPPTATDEFVAISYGVTFGRSVEQVFNTVTVG